ncbi:MAG: hypothetical protein PHX87_05625 [Candidatus Peribacteraceae bacterium]|nr:hypothetical protein [Candidatus Peribacteraceae bacterium]MDD5742872.1 hypothetical protein [Candidatus Peribacteraceae bacterium]
MEKVPSEVGPGNAEAIHQVQIAPVSPVSHTTFECDGTFGDPESVLDTVHPVPGDGDSSSCRGDQTRIEKKDETAEASVDGEEVSVEEILKQVRNLTVLRVLEVLRSRMRGDIGEVAKQVSCQAMSVLRLWIERQANVPMTPAQFSPALDRQINIAVDHAVRENLCNRIAQ